MSTNEIKIFKFFKCFSKIWKIGERYKAERIGARADSYPTPMSTLKKEKKSCSRDILFFYLLNSFERRLGLWDQN